MPKQISKEELDTILALVADRPAGARVGDILKVLPFALEKRSLQRRLALLVKQQRLVPDGQGKGLRYHVAARASGGSTARIKTRAEGHGEASIPLSPAGQSIRRAIRAPVQNRQPVGYQRVFLDDYQPNQTHYLSAETREHLLNIGAPPGGERPAGTYARTILSRLLMDLSWNSSRLEGNTYSLLETERLLELGEAATGRDAREAQIILNHKAAIEQKRAAFYDSILCMSR